MMIRTTIIAGGLLGLGIFTAAPAMAVPGMDVRCSPPSICPVITTWQNGLAQAGSVWAGAPGQVASVWAGAPGQVASVWAGAPGQVASVWAGAPAQVAKVWHDATVGP
jgi:hypothetical protein